MQKPDFRKTRINTEEYFKSYSEKDIERLIAEDLERKAGIVGRPTKRKVIILTKDACGSAGREHYAEVTLTVDHEYVAEG